MAIMKPGTIPTSPQHRLQFNPTQHSRLGQVWIILSSVVVGGMAGWCAAILTQLYPQWLPNETTSKVVFIKNDQENSTAQIADVVSTKTAATVVTLYPEKTINFNDAVPLGRGVLLSADGWIVTAQTVLEQHSSVTVVLNDGRVFVTSQFVSDSYNNTTYLKINGNELPIVNFASKPIMVGELAIWYTPGVTTNPTINFSRIINTGFSTTAIFSTRRNTIVYLSDFDSPKDVLGAPVFNQSGEIIGLNVLNHQILPVHSIQAGMYQILAAGKISHAITSLEYQPLYWTVNTDTAKQTGVRVTAVHSKQSVFQVDDIITALNGITLDEHNDLSIMLNTLTIPTASVTWQRNGNTTTADINVKD